MGCRSKKVGMWEKLSCFYLSLLLWPESSSRALILTLSTLSTSIFIWPELKVIDLSLQVPAQQKLGFLSFCETTTQSRRKSRLGFSKLPDPQFLSKDGTSKVLKSQDSLELTKITWDSLGRVKESGKVAITSTLTDFLDSPQPFFPKICPSKSY